MRIHNNESLEGCPQYPVYYILESILKIIQHFQQVFQKSRKKNKIRLEASVLILVRKVLYVMYMCLIRNKICLNQNPGILVSLYP